MPISPELQRVYASAPVNDHYIETLSLTHPAFTDGVKYITNSKNGWNGNLEDDTLVFYQYAPFVAIPPNGAEQAALTLQVGIDNSNREIMEELENISDTPSVPVEVVYRVYLESDPTTLQNNPPLKLDVSSVLATQDVVSFAASMTNLRNMPFPSQLYTTDLYPGLER